MDCGGTDVSCRKSIANGEAKDAYYGAHDRVVAIAGGKEVWTTETGWPIKGDTVGNAVASVENLQSFWWDVACGSFASNINTFWYILVGARQRVLCVERGG